MKRFYPYQLWFLVPGIGLVIASIYIPISYLHKQLFWTETEAVIDGQVERGSGEIQVFCLMNFTDAQGLVYHIEANTENTFMDGKDSNHVRIYYDPFNPNNFELVNPGRYLLILFLPFGLLCVYLGWPENVTSKRYTEQS